MKLTIKEKKELGRSLIVLGRTLRDGVDPEISEEALSHILSLAPHLPKAEEPQQVRQPKVDGLMELIFGWVRDGEPIPSGAHNKSVQNALTKLRRNGQIVNDGSVRSPKWRITTPGEQAQIANEVRERRKEYDRNRVIRS